MRNKETTRAVKRGKVRKEKEEMLEEGTKKKQEKGRCQKRGNEKKKEEAPKEWKEHEREGETLEEWEKGRRHMRKRRRGKRWGFEQTQEQT